MINIHSRYQNDFHMHDMYPSIEGFCSCGCGKKLSGKQKRWASKECNEISYAQFSIIKGNSQSIRNLLYFIQKGFCQVCGVYDPLWQADHIRPVLYGGGACDISNFQTLCVYCHNEKTQNQMLSHRAKISSHAHVNPSMVLTYAAGDTEKLSSKISTEMHALASI